MYNAKTLTSLATIRPFTAAAIARDVERAVAKIPKCGYKRNESKMLLITEGTMAIVLSRIVMVFNWREIGFY